MSYPWEVVWMTTQASGTPHAAALQEANPGVVTHVCHSPQGVGDGRQYLWRNCDRHIRRWWAANRESVLTDQVLFLEYDVYCNADLRDHLPVLGGDYGLAGPRIVSGLMDIRSYWPFEDIPRMPREMQALACAVAPLALVLITRAALDAVCERRYDPIFAEDIFCETRLPTVIRHAGFRVVAINLPDVHVTPHVPCGRGIFHPVKQPVL